MVVKNEAVLGDGYDVYLDSDGVWKKKTYMDIGSGVKKFVVFEETETQVFVTVLDTVLCMKKMGNNDTLKDTNPWVWEIWKRIGVGKDIYIYIYRMFSGNCIALYYG